ncbi:hypothetical protein EU803_14055 [Loktanella sp. IMCC34160]|uniref:hypothetical protein n=1 Tax=Loktanella sp. IMCC34160 TaxID=2510646 RepID=UPI00101BB712|nr:hypothetical protein [Loktanella sp. IMCC34160]RYG90347.1 hypothetical protein EU803_14055 [Loktanella sp. IMCC34160]
MFEAPDGFLEEISDAAAFGLALASASWIDVRLSGVSSDPMLSQVIAAGWANMLEPEASDYFEPDDEEWVGPVRAPLATTAIILMDAMYGMNLNPDIRLRTSWMADFARYVLEDDAETFDAWFNWAADRLARVHPRSEMPKLGLFDVPVRFEPVVGRDVFVPETDYDPATARSSLYNWLMQGDRDNPFIDFSELRP